MNTDLSKLFIKNYLLVCEEKLPKNPVIVKLESEIIQKADEDETLEAFTKSEQGRLPVVFL